MVITTLHYWHQGVIRGPVGSHNAGIRQHLGQWMLVFLIWHDQKRNPRISENGYTTADCVHNLQHVPEKDSFRLVQETKDNCEHSQVYGNKSNDTREFNSERVKTRQEINVWG